MIKNILFDFDGVILDSMPIRGHGFKEIFKKYPNKLVKKMLDYHNKNGGLSRYIKIKYFYNNILNQDISEEKISDYAEIFSIIMKKKLTNKKYLICNTMNFIEKNYKKYNMHIVSGSDEKELQYLCRELEIYDYFQSISGSPKHKNELVENIFLVNNYLTNETVLIGDSINDYDAAKKHNFDFYGFNNLELKKISKKYIINFNDVRI